MHSLRKCTVLLLQNRRMSIRVEKAKQMEIRELPTLPPKSKQDSRETFVSFLWKKWTTLGTFYFFKGKPDICLMDARKREIYLVSVVGHNWIFFSQTLHCAESQKTKEGVGERLRKNHILVFWTTNIIPVQQRFSIFFVTVPPQSESMSAGTSCA